MKLLVTVLSTLLPRVAPRAGAWIEAADLGRASEYRTGSLPVRERGLKQTDAIAWLRAGGVAPRAGAWIEAHQRRRGAQISGSLPVRERGLKHVSKAAEHGQKCRSPCGSVD